MSQSNTIQKSQTRSESKSVVAKKTKIAIIVTVIPNYREGFYENLFANESFDIQVFCMEDYPGAGLNTVHDKFPSDKVKVGGCIATKKGEIVWQYLPFRKLYKEFDLFFIEGNPRVVTHALFASFLKFTKKKLVVWSMVHSFENPGLTENIRLRWISYFKNHFLYNASEIESLKQRGFKNKNMIAMNNGLNQKKIDAIIDTWTEEKLSAFKSEKKLTADKIILSCGRLRLNNFMIIVKALPAIIQSIPDLIWVAIGKGTDREKMESEAKKLGVLDHIIFPGAIYDDEQLTPWFLSAKIFVHPNAIGLSMLHAFGYGLPVITHGVEELHGPEYVAFESEVTGKNFEKNNIESFAKKVVELLNDNAAVKKMSLNNKRITQQEYNVDVMANRFEQMVEKVLSEG